TGHADARDHRLHRIRSQQGQSIRRRLRRLGSAGSSMFTQIDHVGIAVEDLDTAIKLWSGFGLTDVTIETVEEQGVKIAMLPVGGGGKVELLQPLNERSPVA